MTSLSEILKMCEDWDEEPHIHPDECSHENKVEKMYCTLCYDCGTVVEHKDRSTFYAKQNPDGTLDIIGPA